MIPLRVKLKGFLCYKDEQEVSFDGSSLWMLSGLNGSGKSSIFDAVTYSLFGHHRGGSTGASELINKKSDSLEVEFDFLQEGQAFRVHRTLRRKARGGTSSTQQVYQRISCDGNGKYGWEAVPDTTKRVDFDRWVRENIGLNYETFTSSVLLLQGKAEKLLDSAAKGRFEVLAGIVDLDRFRELAERSDEAKRVRDATVKSLRDRRAALPEVSAIDLNEAEVRVETVEADRKKAWDALQRWQTLEVQAKQFEEKQDRLTVLRKQLKETEALLAEADEIERDLNRLKELQAVLPVVEHVMGERGRIDDTKRKLGELDKHKCRIEETLQGQDAELEKARKSRSQLEAAVERDEKRQRDVNGELRVVSGQLEKLQEFERLEQQLKRVRDELKRMPESPAKEVEKAQVRCDELNALSQVVPQLARLSEAREELRETLQSEKSALETREKIKVKGKKLREQLDELAEQVAEAAKIKEDADANATRMRTLLEQAREHLQEVSMIDGAKVCRTCGQALTPGHIEEEKVKRKQELAEVEQEHKAAIQAQKDAAKKEKELRKKHIEVDQACQAARDEYVEFNAQAGQANKDLDRLRKECGRIYGELPQDFRVKISEDLPDDWLATSYPAFDELSQLRQKVDDLSHARRTLREAETQLNKWNQLKGQETSAEEDLARVRSQLPKDPKTVRDQHTKLETEEKTLLENVASQRRALNENQKTLDKLGKQREQTQQQLAKCQSDTQTQTATLELCKQTLAKSLKDLPDHWKEPAERALLSEWGGWKRERDDLVAKGTEERSKKLQESKLAIEGVQREAAEVEKQIEAFPEEARQGVMKVQACVSEARNKYEAANEELNNAKQHKASLEALHKQREQLDKEFLEADKNLVHSKLLSELLGRDRLQLHLVRQAERQVVDHANAVLDRLSGGELYLRLVGEAGGEGNAAKALELEAHNRVTGERPINVSFLSGSQKFRVAVALALGIGQYASKQHRPIESVIIDEGFGCLDRNARQVMIQELQNLRTQMRCILLVSHQEEFADAFTDGYHFELQNGTTVAKRFQR